MQPTDIDVIRDQVRNFYATGNKSGNKVYAKSKSEVLTQDAFERKQQGFFNRLFASRKFAQRNKNVALSQKFRPTSWGNAPYEFGQQIWNSSIAAEFRSGNCGEMACVSSYLAVAQYMASRAKVYLGCVTPPGDHAFCLLALSNPPAWRRVRDMSGAGESGSYVIDPWLNIACEAGFYGMLAAEKLEKWHRDGKRVSWGGPNDNAPGWYDPVGTYADAFRDSPLQFVAV